jgi:N-methylhydantoinase B
MLGSDDVLIFFAPGGGGFGDPLDREPERVAHDVGSGWVSRTRAETTYGVALAADGTVDRVATDALRETIRGTRKQRPTTTWISKDRCEPPQGASHAWRVGANVELAADGTLHCMRCGEALSGAQGRVAIADRRLDTAGPWMALRYRGDGPNFVLREISCPSCATLLSVREVRRNGGGTG